MNHPRVLNFNRAYGLLKERKGIRAGVIMSDYREVNQAILGDIVAVKVQPHKFRIFADHRCTVGDLSPCVECLGQHRGSDTLAHLLRAYSTRQVGFAARHRKICHSYRCGTTSHRRTNLQCFHTEELGFFRYKGCDMLLVLHLIGQHIAGIKSIDPVDARIF